MVPFVLVKMVMSEVAVVDVVMGLWQKWLWWM
jgi:hypothetical protein